MSGRVDDAADWLRLGHGSGHRTGRSTGSKMRVAIKRLKKEFDEIERSAGDLPFTVHPLEVGRRQWRRTGTRTDEGS